MEIKCPKCGQECEGESVKVPWFLECECECGFIFSYDDYRSEYFDNDGNIIKEELNDR